MEVINSSNWLRLLRDDILHRGTLFPSSGGGVSLMFFTIEDGFPVAVHRAPTTEQILMPIRHLPVEPDTWYNVIVFNIGRDLHGTEFEFIPGNTFTSKFYVVSDMARNNAQFRLSAIDISTNVTLATGTVSVNLGTTGIISPVIITGPYTVPAVVQSENIRMILQIMSPLFGVQIGLLSRPPNEISYISRLMSGELPSTI